MNSHRFHDLLLFVVWPLVALLLACGTQDGSSGPATPSSADGTAPAGSIVGTWTGSNAAPCAKLKGEDTLTIEDDLSGHATLYPIHGWCVYEKPRDVTLQASPAPDGSYTLRVTLSNKQYPWTCRLAGDQLACALPDGEKTGPFLAPAGELATYSRRK